MTEYHFFELLKGFRNREQLSQSILSERVGVSRPTLSDWENKRIPTRDMVLALSESLTLNGDETNQLLASAGYMPNKLQAHVTPPDETPSTHRSQLAERPSTTQEKIQNGHYFDHPQYQHHNNETTIPKLKDVDTQYDMKMNQGQNSSRNSTRPYLYVGIPAVLCILGLLFVLLNKDVESILPQTDCQWPMISEGVSGDAVKHAQHQLLKVGGETAESILSRGGATGHFGSGTKQAVTLYQQLVFPNQPVEWDGIIGPKTWRKLGCDSHDEPIRAPQSSRVAPSQTGRTLTKPQSFLPIVTLCLRVFA